MTVRVEVGFQQLSWQVLALCLKHEVSSNAARHGKSTHLCHPCQEDPGLPRFLGQSHSLNFLSQICVFVCALKMLNQTLMPELNPYHMTSLGLLKDTFPDTNFNLLFKLQGQISKS